MELSQNEKVFLTDEFIDHLKSWGKDAQKQLNTVMEAVNQLEDLVMYTDHSPYEKNIYQCLKTLSFYTNELGDRADDMKAFANILKLSLDWERLEMEYSDNDGMVQKAQTFVRADNELSA
jgi:hypothetical protein